MGKRKLFLIGLLIWNFSSVCGQECGTPHPINPTIYPQENPNIQARGSSSALCVDVFFHIVRNSNGTNAFSNPNTNNIVKELNKFYSSQNIIINNAGTSFINNSNNLLVDFDEAKTIANSRNQNEVINYYIVDDIMEYNGFALNIPSDALFIRDTRIYTSTSAHELGHCLGLYHKHKGLAYGESGCAEAVNGSNCNNCGDLVCDTPADNGEVNTNGFTPDLTNIMSYFHLYGYNRNHFTNGQGYRMRYAIQNESILQNITSNSCTSITEVNNVCYPQTKTVNLSNIGNATTSWTSSSNVQILSSNNSSASIRASGNNSWNDTGWIKANISNGIKFTEEFWVGDPSSNGLVMYSSGNFDIATLKWYQLTAHHNNFSYLEHGGLKYEWQIPYVQLRQTPPRNKVMSVFPTQTGTYAYRLRSKNECGCSSWITKYFNVTNQPSQGDGKGYHISPSNN